METRTDGRNKVKAWMSAPRHTVAADAPLTKAWRMMRRHRIRHLLVIDDGRLVGVISDRDLHRPSGDLWQASADYLFERDLRARQVMSENPITVDEEEATGRAARLMIEKRIGCLPVMQNHECVGIVTTSDLLKALAYAVDPDATWGFEMAHSA